MAPGRQIGVLNVLYENAPSEVRQYYAALERHARREGIGYRVFTLDNSRQSRRDLVPAGATYRHFPENIGYTRAANLLTAEALAAGCDVILATNLDGFFMSGCLTGLLETLRAYGGNALVEARQFPNEHRKAYDRTTGATNWVAGCCVMTGRRTIEKLGPYDEALFLYHEDVDYSFRAQAAGIPCIVSPSALFFHRRPDTNFADRLRYLCMSGRHVAAKWRRPDVQRLWEKRMVANQIFSSLETLPPFPPEMATYDCPVAWDPEGFATFSRQRWPL